MIENRKAANEMSRNALRASKEKYRWEHMERRLFEAYDTFLGSRGYDGQSHAR
jgi:hypothetical protein